MSPLASAVLEFSELLHRETGEDPKRLVLPQRAYAMLWRELEETCEVVETGEPISGVSKNGRLWLACIEIVPDASERQGLGDD